MLFRTRAAPDVLTGHALTRNERFLQFFAFGMTFSHVVAEEALVQFDLARERWRAIQSDEAWRALPEADKNDFVRGLFEDIARDIASHHQGGRPWLGFSSGLDSRFLYHALTKAGLPLGIYTFGQVGTADFDFSRIAADRIGLHARLFDTSELAWSLEYFDRITPRLRDRPISPRVVVAGILSAELGGYLDIHGYLNGRLTGGIELDSPSRDWASAKRAFCAKNDQFGFQRFMGAAAPERLLPRKPFDCGLSLDRQLDLGYRQYQRIRPSDHQGVVHLCPYADDRWVGFWLNRGHDDLVGQSRYVSMLGTLGSAAFFDFQELLNTGQAITKPGRQAWIKANRTIPGADRAKSPPLAAGAHFCVHACYVNNPSFRLFVDESVARMRGRSVFSRGFIDEAMNRLGKADKVAEKLVKGIVSLDICIEAGLF